MSNAHLQNFTYAFNVIERTVSTGGRSKPRDSNGTRGATEGEGPLSPAPRERVFSPPDYWSSKDLMSFL